MHLVVMYGQLPVFRPSRGDSRMLMCPWVRTLMRTRLADLSMPPTAYLLAGFLTAARLMAMQPMTSISARLQAGRFDHRIMAHVFVCVSLRLQLPPMDSFRLRHDCSPCFLDLFGWDQARRSQIRVPDTNQSNLETTKILGIRHGQMPQRVQSPSTE